MPVPASAASGRARRRALAFALALAGTLLVGPARGAEFTPVDRPDPPGTVTEVKLGVFVMDLASIDDATQTFNADFFLIRRWRDARLAFEPEAVPLRPAAALDPRGVASYLTRADQFVLGSSVLVYLALAETIFSGKLNVGGRPELARRIDQHARWVYATLFVLVAVVTLGV
jgi:hypothetical protein